jgi:GTP cyclohydrolase I
MEKLFKQLITEIGEDMERPGLIKTPERAAKAWEFLTAGYHQDLETIVNDAIFHSTCKDMVIVKNIEFYSLCEHHLLPFIGKCHVGYIPRDKVLGVSKIARITELYARRLQIQETLTHEIAVAIEKVTNAIGVGVVMEAKHLCMMMRGVEKQNSEMTTSAMLGTFRDKPQTRSEFLSLIK